MQSKNLAVSRQSRHAPPKTVFGRQHWEMLGNCKKVVSSEDSGKNCLQQFLEAAFLCKACVLAATCAYQDKKAAPKQTLTCALCRQKGGGNSAFLGKRGAVATTKGSAGEIRGRATFCGSRGAFPTRLFMEDCVFAAKCGGDRMALGH